MKLDSKRGHRVITLTANETQTLTRAAMLFQEIGQLLGCADICTAAVTMAGVLQGDNERVKLPKSRRVEDTEPGDSHIIEEPPGMSDDERQKEEFDEMIAERGDPQCPKCGCGMTRAEIARGRSCFRCEPVKEGDQ